MEGLSLFPSLPHNFKLCRIYLRPRTLILKRGAHLNYDIIAKPDLFQTVPKRQKSQPGSVHEDEEKPLPLRKLLVYPVILSISNYVVLAFLNISLSALLPLFLAMPLEIGGLDLDPPKIGYIIGLNGIGYAILQALCFAPIVRYFGERKVFIMAISTFLPIFLSLPVINMAAVILGKQSPVVWLAISILLVCQTLLGLAYGKF